MGSSQSSDTGTPNVTVSQAGADKLGHQQEVPDDFFGVRVVGNKGLTNDDAVQEAFDRGKQEGMQMAQSYLGAAAKQAYSNVQEQLDAIEKEEKQKAKETVARLKSRLATAHPVTKACPDLEKKFAECLNSQNKGGDPLACKDQLETLASCVNETIANKAKK